MKKVSIIIPIFNSESTIDNCIDSIVRQTYKNIEIILVDDGSTDRTKNICQKYAARDNRIIYLRKRNGGVSSSRNLGIRQATGEYILFVDSDDSVKNDMIEKMISNHKKGCMEVCGFNIVFPHKTINTHPKIKRQTSVQAILPRAIDTKRSIGGYVCGKLFESRIINKYNIRFNEQITMLEDGLFVTEYLTYISAINPIDEPLYNYIQSKNSTTHTSLKHISSVEKALDGIEAINKHYNPKASLDYIYFVKKNYALDDEEENQKKAIKTINIRKLKIPVRLKLRYYIKLLAKKTKIEKVLSSIRHRGLYD